MVLLLSLSARWVLVFLRRPSGADAAFHASSCRTLVPFRHGSYARLSFLCFLTKGFWKESNRRAVRIQTLKLMKPLFFEVPKPNNKAETKTTSYGSLACRLRVSLSAAHSYDDVDELIRLVRESDVQLVRLPHLLDPRAALPQPSSLWSSCGFGADGGGDSTLLPYSRL